MPLPIAPRWADERLNDEKPFHDIELLASFLAQERGLPLLADDRICQSLIYGDPKSPPGTYAFGTDRLVLTLADANVLNADEAADAYLQLVRWRYRFLVPPDTLLKTLAVRHIDHPPGKELREIARYVHDCMRDAGIPLEQASGFGTSALANWLFLEWVQSIVSMVCLLWHDEQIPVNQAEICTDWCVRTLLPSPPRAVGQYAMTVQLPVTGFSNHVLRHALLRLMDLRTISRGQRALRSIALALGIPEDRHTTAFARASYD